MARGCLVLRLTESGLDNIDDSLASVNVGDDLSPAGGIFGTFLHDNNLWRLN